MINLLLNNRQLTDDLQLNPPRPPNHPQLSEQITFHHGNRETTSAIVVLEILKIVEMLYDAVEKLLFNVDDAPEAHADEEVSAAHGAVVGHGHFEAGELFDVL